MRKFLLQGRGGDKATKAIEPANSTAERETKLNILGRDEHSPQYTSHLTENKAVEASKMEHYTMGKAYLGVFGISLSLGLRVARECITFLFKVHQICMVFFFIFTSILNRGWASAGEIMGNSALDGVSLTLEGPHLG